MCVCSPGVEELFAIFFLAALLSLGYIRTPRLTQAILWECVVLQFPASADSVDRSLEDLLFCIMFSWAPSLRLPESQGSACTTKAACRAPHGVPPSSLCDGTALQLPFGYHPLIPVLAHAILNTLMVTLMKHLHFATPSPTFPYLSETYQNLQVWNGREWWLGLETYRIKALYPVRPEGNPSAHQGLPTLTQELPCCNIARWISW